MSVASPEVLLPQLRYVDRSRTASDVNTLIRQINSLQCKISQHVSNTGVTETLLLLFGTIPIYYKGVQYNIPVHIWIPELYPQRPPTCYVTPTREMRIKARHKHVDTLGMIYLPYLNQWNPLTSSLAELVTFMSSVFSEDPPVFKYNPDAAVVPPAAVTPVVGHPSHAPHHMHHPNHSPAQSPPVTSSHLHPSSQSQSRSPAASSRTIVTPPTQVHNPFFTPSTSSSSTSSSISSSLSSPALHSTSNSSSISSISSISSSSPSSSSVSQSQPQPQLQPQSQPQDPRALRKEQLIADVTTQLQTMLLTFNTDRTTTIDQLFDTQSKLSANTDKLQSQMTTMQQQQQKFRELNEQLIIKTAHLQQWLQGFEKKQLTLAEIDQAVYCKDTWSKQLVDCVADDQAIEDTLYVLDRALLNQNIDLDTFLKQVRHLARKQFTARHLATKIQHKMANAQQPVATNNTNTSGVGQVPLPSAINPTFQVYQPPLPSSSPPAVPPRSPGMLPYMAPNHNVHAHNHLNNNLSPYPRT